MYTKRVQIANYGPISHLDIELPFFDDHPKPIVLVGPNGCGKSIFLSHVVNGLVSAKDLAFPDASEVEVGKVLKIRDPLYIREGSDWSFSKVHYENDLFIRELTLHRSKSAYEEPPDLHDSDAQSDWTAMRPEEHSRLTSSFTTPNKSKVMNILSQTCIVYFPHNRFEEPAWLNEDNLKSQATYMGVPRVENYTSRTLINYSPMHSNQNWLFDVLYDRYVFEMQQIDYPLRAGLGGHTINLPLLAGYSGSATRVYDIALQIIRTIMNNDTDVQFGIGRRLSRVVSLHTPAGRVVPNIFQLSSGQLSLLNIFLSILRDYDLTGTSFTTADDIRGIAVVDEVDLHLHAVHQNEILPNLVQMFPKVQFIITTHSPLFVLGMRRAFGEEGFALYRLPHGQQISPEEFSEFGDAYQALTLTSQFAEDIQTAIRDAQIPILYVEGSTDKKYLRKAAELLDRQGVLEQFKVVDGGESGKLTNIWRALTTLSGELVPRKVVILFDCEVPGDSDSKGNRFKCKHPLQSGHPIRKGIENLFGSSTLGRARGYEEGFFDITPEHPAFVGGQPQAIPEAWSVREGQKTALYDWLCEHGTIEDFRHFQETLDLLAELLQAEDAA